MLKQSILFFALASSLSLFSCKLTSVTTIKGNDSFVLGNNQHGSFTVKLTNTSDMPIEICEAPVAGGKHSTVAVGAGKTVKASVDANTALIVQNANAKPVDVKLVVKGDVGLSMGYQNQ